MNVAPVGPRHRWTPDPVPVRVAARKPSRRPLMILPRVLFGTGGPRSVRAAVGPRGSVGVGLRRLHEDVFQPVRASVDEAVLFAALVVGVGDPGVGAVP